MARLLCTLSIAILCASTASAADDKLPELTIYGVGHLSVDNSSNTTNQSAQLASNSSRLGVKGNYALNNQFSLIGQFEKGIDLTGSGKNDGNGSGDTGNIFSRTRDSFVGVKSDWGTVKWGRQGILNQWVYDYNLFADQVGDLGNIWGGSGFAGRANNAISYETPTLYGVNGLVLYTPDSVDAAGKSITALKINYVNGPIALGVGYGDAKQKAPASNDYTIFAATGSYTKDKFDVGGVNLGGSNIGFGYQHESDVAGANGNNRDDYTLGAALKIERQHTLKAQYTYSKADIAHQNASQFAVGYDYAFNDNLSFYAAYASVLNGSGIAFQSNGYGHGKSLSPSGTGADPNAISFGVVYKFDYGIR